MYVKAGNRSSRRDEANSKVGIKNTGHISPLWLKISPLLLLSFLAAKAKKKT